MYRKVQTILSCIISVLVGTWVGHAVYLILFHANHPERFIGWSAPWYLSIIIWGIFALVIIVLTVIAKLVLRAWNKKKV